jgi:predicted TIM-barrel fold metal-dependent hydrolase
MLEPDHPIIDADNHYYEPDDCCTRHLEAGYRDRSVHCVRDTDGTGRWLFGARPLRFHLRARDRVLRPGDLRALMSGLPAGEWEMVGSDEPAWRNRDARLATMDAQGIEAAIIAPSFGVAFEAEIADDVEAVYANFRAFNRWIEDDWGYAYRDRIFTTPFVSMLDPHLALAETERLLEANARLILMNPGPAGFGRSPADRVFDPVWARIEEAGVPVVYHISVTAYFDCLSPMWGENPATASEEAMTPFQGFLCFGSRPIADTIANIVMRGLFDRFPHLRVISLEHGSSWVKDIVKTDRAFRATVSTTGIGKEGRSLRRLPSQVMRENVLVAPFHEESFRDLVDLTTPSQVLFGSDWPHPEGTPTPRDMLSDLEDLTPTEVRLVAHDNAARLLGLTV